MGKLSIYSDTKPMSGCGYKIVELMTEKGKETEKVVCESTFNLERFMDDNPKYKNAFVIRTEKVRGVTVFYLKRK